MTDPFIQRLAEMPERRALEDLQQRTWLPREGIVPSCLRSVAIDLPLHLRSTGNRSCEFELCGEAQTHGGAARRRRRTLHGSNRSE